MRIGRALLVTPSLLALAAACGSSTPSVMDDAGSGSNAGAYLNCVGTANGTTVLDANGNAFRFAASNGSMHLVSSGEGPFGFCLTASSSSGTGWIASR